ncbi:MAG: serine hydrolase domain-containing protein [Lysobacterales bacterium]
MASLLTLNTIHSTKQLFPRLALVSVMAIAGCGSDAPPSAEPQSAADAPAATQISAEAPDPVFLRNMAAMQKQPGVTELEWRQPKEVVAGTADSELPGPSGFAAAAAFDAAAEYHNQHGGLGLMVWHKGSLAAQTFADELTPLQHFSTFSMHKSVLAIAILAAIEDGIISSVDDSVGSYIEEWSGDPRGDISLRHFLTHSSGLKHFALGGQSTEAANLMLSSKVSQTALSFPLAFEPGTRFNYSNANSQIAGVVLERALAKSGRRYADYLSARVWQPLGNAPAALWLEAEGGSPRFYSGLEAGLTDWLRLGVMLANNGSAGGKPILSPESVASLSTPSANNSSYGLHVWLGGDWHAQRLYGPETPLTVAHEAPFMASDVTFFDGFGGQRVYIIPSAELVVARAGNVDMTYDDSIIVNTLLRGLKEQEIATNLETYRSGTAEATYDARFAQLVEQSRAGSGLGGYDPLIELPGADNVVPLPRDPASAPWLDGETRQWLDQFGAGNNSAAIMVWQKGKVIYENYFGDTRADSLIITRSLSKPISIMAMGRALKLGYIQSLDQPVDQFFTEWKDSDKSSMTLRHLLQMRSGLARQGQAMEPESYLNRAYLHPYHIEVILHDYPMEHEPGTRYDYSNANSELVAPLIERATGRPYQDWVGEEVFEPLGAAGGQIWVNRPGGTVHSGCCALLPAETFLRLSVLIINDGVWEGERLLPEGYVDAITSATEYNPHTGMGMYVAGPYVTNRGAANPDVPFGHTLHSEPYLDKDLYLFDGNGHQVSYHIPRHDLIILRVGVRPPKEVTWDNAELPNHLLRQYASATGAELVPQQATQ